MTTYKYETKYVEEDTVTGATIATNYGALEDTSDSSDVAFGGVMLSKGESVTDETTDSQQRAVIAIQVGKTASAAAVKDAAGARLLKFSSGPLLSSAKVARKLILSQPAYQALQTKAQTVAPVDLTIQYGKDNALNLQSISSNFMTHQFSDGAVMSTYSGNRALEATALSADNTVEVWSTLSSTPVIPVINGWSETLENNLIGEKKWLGGLSYLYRKGDDVTLNLGNYHSTSIGSSDDGRFATKELYGTNTANFAGSRWLMLDEGKWPTVKVDSASVPDDEDTKTWLTGTRTVKYSTKTNIDLSGDRLRDCLVKAGVVGVNENLNNAGIAARLTPLSNYADLQLGDSYNFPVGNTFNFFNHAASMDIHVGPSATINIWSKNPGYWKLGKGVEDKSKVPDNWASLEKTVGDSYSYHWGGDRSFVESSNGQNQLRDGNGRSFEKLVKKSSETSVTDTLKSYTSYGANVAVSLVGVKASNESIGWRKVSSKAEYGLNLDVSLGPLASFGVNMEGLTFAYKMPADEALLYGQLLFDIEYKSRLASTSVTMVGNVNQLNINAIKFIGDTTAAKVEEKAAAMNNKVSAEPKTQTEAGCKAETNEGIELSGKVNTVDVDAVKLNSAGSTVGATGTAADTAALHGIAVGTNVQP